MERPVTYSEVGADYRVDMAQVINYFQDCSCFQSDRGGTLSDIWRIDYGRNLAV